MGVPCVVCSAADARRVWSVAKVPAFPCRPAGAVLRASDFGSLAIAECSTCGHLHNAAFEAGRAEALYAAALPTNQPVSPGMVKALDGTAAQVLAHAPANPRVLEVGGGGGALALQLATQAREVHLIEPSLALSEERFAGSRVTLHRAMFPAPSLGDKRFDLVVCRHVVEHVPDPQPFLAALRAALADGGIAYIELPNADYIRANRALLDFHYPHIHYFRPAGIEALFARAGFAVAERIAIKDGHDMGFLLRPAGVRDTGAQGSGAEEGLAAALAAGRQRGGERLAALAGPVALYGANAYSQALLGLYPEVASLAGMFDDTPAYAGYVAYGAARALPIERPSPERLRAFAAVVITAYLHDAEIARKLAAHGFEGPVLTVRSDAHAGEGERPPSLFR